MPLNKVKEHQLCEALELIIHDECPTLDSQQIYHLVDAIVHCLRSTRLIEFAPESTLNQLLQLAVFEVTANGSK